VSTKSANRQVFAVINTATVMDQIDLTSHGAQNRRHRGSGKTSDRNHVVGNLRVARRGAKSCYSFGLSQQYGFATKC
jgi:hypothetical protein